jgi:hypothetical protein
VVRIAFKGAAMMRDRAAAVCTAILQIIKRARGAELRQRIEAILRDEFHDERRQGVADRGTRDE